LIDCILDHYSNLFTSSNNQFSLKKQTGCAQAIYVFRRVIDYYVSSGSTVNVCAIDVAKAFDKMNHYGLFIELMKRRILDNLLLLLESWFAIGMTCVKWHNVWSKVVSFKLWHSAGWGAVPLLICHIHRQFSHTCISIIFYADDVLLLAPSVSSLKLILSVCEK